MIVYHGSAQIVEKPNIQYSKKYLDFGRGFYLTTFQHQAEKWAVRKGNRLQKAGIVNVYELEHYIDRFRVLKFEKENELWLDFVCACRRGEDIYKDYDIIIGNVANDDVFKTVDMYFQGLWDKQRTIAELRYYKMNNQINIVSQAVLDEALHFKESYQV